MRRSMQEVVSEFNKLTGNNLKRFATVDIGESRIASFKARTIVESKVKQKKPAPSVHKQRIAVDDKPYRSVAAAFDELGLPMSQHIGFRKKLHNSGRLAFEHAGKSYHFAVIREE